MKLKKNSDLKKKNQLLKKLHINEKDKLCPTCDYPLHEMSKEIRKELKIIPAQVKIVEHIRYVYACRQCEKENISTPVITAKMPNPVLKASFVSPSLLAYIMNHKYSEAIPLYRQEQQFKNFGIELSRQNLANWIIHGANNWLKYLYNRIHKTLLKESIIHADETTMQVLSEEGKNLQVNHICGFIQVGNTLNRFSCTNTNLQGQVNILKIF